jgi:hypothetical protein
LDDHVLRAFKCVIVANGYGFKYNLVGRMSVESFDAICPFQPFHAIIENGLQRMLEIVKSDSFTFVVNGDQIQSTVVEAALLFPAVCGLLQHDARTLSFVISSSDIESNDFVSILGFVRSFDTVLSKDRISQLLLIINML